MAAERFDDLSKWGLPPNETPKNFDDPLAIAMGHLEKLLTSYKDPSHIPSVLENRPEFLRIHSYLKDLKRVLSRFADGELDEALAQKGATAGYVKAMQASLRHLAWQFNSVASGDLEQRVDYLGQFSAAFNRMTESLKRQRRELEDKQRQLTALTQKLKDEIREKDAVEAALRESEFTYRQMALRDSLTGIYNRGYFFEIAHREIESLKRQDGDLCLVMADVDHFKKYNDSFGHLAGDAALKTFTKAVAGLLRKTDLFARYGGEEFILLLVKTKLDMGLVIAERIRAAVAAIEPPEPHMTPITVSLGVAHMSGQNVSLDADVEHILKDNLSKADAALYMAKENGRNQVWWHGRARVPLDPPASVPLDRPDASHPPRK